MFTKDNGFNPNRENRMNTKTLTLTSESGRGGLDR